MRWMVVGGVFVATLGSAGVGAAQAQWWTHERLVEGLSVEPSNQYAFVNPSGTAVFFAVTPTGGNVFVGSRNFSLDVLGGFHSARPYGVTDDGVPIWTAKNHLWVGESNISQGVTSSVDFVPEQSGRGGHFVFRGWEAGREKVYVGTTDLTSQVLGEDGRGSFPSAPNPAGQVAWNGKGSGTDGHWDVFVGSLNVSSFLGPGRYVAGARLDDSGHVAWVGKSPLTGNRMKVFVGTRDITTEALGVGGEGFLNWMNRRGDVVWRGLYGVERHVMLNSTSISASVFGQGRDKQFTTSGISENGHVLWGSIEITGDRLFLDDVDLGASVIGPDARAGTDGRINASGHVLWTGGRSDGSAWGVYYDSFNLSRDALGLEYAVAVPLAIGDGGHSLWYVERGTAPYFTYDVWLSTPVPEPGGALALPFALGLLALGRRMRSQ